MSAAVATEPLSAEQIEALQKDMPLVAREVLGFTLHMMREGQQVNSLLLEKNGIMGATQFSTISDDKTGAMHVLFRMALERLGVTSAAAVFEARAGVQDPETGLIKKGAPTQDIIGLYWWEKGGKEGHLMFRVDSKGPKPRTLFYDEPIGEFQSRFAGLLDPVGPKELNPRFLAYAQQHAQHLAHELSPMFAPPGGGRHAGKTLQ